MKIAVLAVAWLVAFAFAAAVAAWAQEGRTDRDPRRGPDTAPKAGDAAPDFTLRRLKEEGTVTLSSFKGQKPVVLIFGSYT